MKIKDIKITKENLELTRPYTIAYKTVDAVESVVVKLVGDNGMTGLGTSNTSQYVVGEDVHGTYERMSRANFDELLGRDIGQLGALLNAVHTTFRESVGARIALDIALHDLFTQYLRVPLVKYFGQHHDGLPTSVTIGIKGVEESLEEAEEFMGMGFYVLKVKLGKSLAEDIDRIVEMKAKLPEHVIIRIDANQGWSAADTIKFHESTRELNIELIEQPLPADAIAACKQLPDEVKALVACDESLVTPEDAFKLAENPMAGKIFNIKLMKCAGLGLAREIGTIARTAGIELMWGCNDESMVGITAALHTALSCPNTRYLDLDGSFDLAKDVATGGFKVKDGKMYVTDQPGLGITPNS